jgi:hypothetical protein
LFKTVDIYNKTQTEIDLEFLIDNIFAMFGGRVFQQTVGIPMGTNCATPLADLFLFRKNQTLNRCFSRKTKRS